MEKSKRIEPIVNLAKSSEKEAVKALGEALQVLNSQTEQLNQLIGYKAEYAERLSLSGGKGINVQQLNEYRSFIDKLTLAIDQQSQVVNQAKENLDAKKRFWFAKRGRSKALDAVLDRYLEDELHQLEKKEQSEIDDLNNRSISD